jgi:AcrR family transcriptional regulator
MRYKAGLETRDRIIGATRRLIAAGGLEKTTIKAICEEAGVLPGSFYNLFDSKEQAVLTVVRDAIDAVDPDPGREGTDTVDDLVDAYIQFLEDDADLASVYIRIALSGARDQELQGRVLRHHEGRVARFASAIRRQYHDVSEAEAHRKAETLVVGLNGVALHGTVAPGFDIATHARALAAEVTAPGLSGRHAL